MTYCVFDLLVHDGERIIALPLAERKQRLKELVHGVPRVLFIGDLPADAQVFQAMVAAGLQIEGGHGQEEGQHLPAGGVRSLDWVKIKRPGWNEDRDWRG